MSGESESEPRCPYGSGPHRRRHEILKIRTWHVPREGAPAPWSSSPVDALPAPVTVVLVSGGVGDYTVYLGVGSPGWVSDHGNKLAFEDAVGLFPGLDARKYRE